MNGRQIIVLIVVAIAALTAGFFTGNTLNIGIGKSGIKSEKQVDLRNQSDSLNFFLGINMAYNLQQAPWELNGDLLISGINQVLNDTSMYDPMTADAIFRQLNMDLQAVEEKKSEANAIENLEKGASFLEENGKRAGVVTTESGLQYEVITMGKGPKPSETSTVSVHYEGSLIDGTIFDSSVENGEPVTFPLNGVIPGWTEGLQLMPVGSKYKLYIPSNLAYGSRDTGPIPGNSVLIFTVELLDIVDGE